MKLSLDKAPTHIGIILDGNRRFAKKLMKMPWKGHAWGVKKAREVLGWACEVGIKYMTIYALSYENLKSRPKREMEFILKHFEDEMKAVLKGDHIVNRTKTMVKFIGRINLLPKKIQTLARRVEESTKSYKNHRLNVAIAYGGQQEITDAMVKLAKQVSEGFLKPHEINESLIKHSLYTNGTPYPELIIRTGGDMRLSNFLLWQSAYSELFFLKTYWPELTKEEFLAVLEEYQNRERRFGK